MIGQILVCGAILHANKINSANDAEITKCIETLINAAHHKIYHSSLAYTFLLELLDKLNESQFERIMWPLMQKELKRQWEIQNINTVHFVIKSIQKYPDLVDEDFLSSSLQTKEILTPSSYKHLGRLFWSPNSIMVAVTHPSYEAFGHYLSSVPEKKLLDFWQKEINEILLAPTKYKEIVTLRLLTIIFNDGKIKPKTALSLLSNSFIALITKALKNGKQQKNNESLPALYTELFEAIEKYMKQEGVTEGDKVAFILKFVESPSTLVIEKYTPSRMIHKFITLLKSDGVHQLFEFYKNILLDRKTKNPKSKEGWLHVEREHCVQMLQTLLVQKSVHSDNEWRAEQLQFLLKYGLFYVNKKTDAIVKERESDVLTNDLAHKLKQAFFSSLQAKSQNIETEKATLLAIVEYCNKQITAKSSNKTLRHPLSDEALQAWQKMYTNVTAKKKAKKILYNVFDILLMHMGLQVFVDAQLAIFSIDDLEKCLERSQSKLKAKSKSSEPNEAEWIEVVVDLFLQLLSQSKSFMRTVVDNVFPELCPNLTPAAVDQILMMLDMSEKNPLTPHNAAEESDGDDNESDDENESEEENVEGEADDPDESSGSEDEDLTDADEEGTASDQLRSAISQALGLAMPETDTESVDLNDMDDAEADRLDVALSDAFRSLRKKTGESKKKTKLERTTNTTVMHFRIRVLDLIEIYLKTSPSLAITLNILTDLIPMYEQCVGNKDHQPLVNRLQRVLRMLLNLREFSNIANVNEVKLYELFQSIINVKTNPAAINEQNKLRSNLSAFLIAVSQLLKSPDQILLEAVAGCLENFLKTRNPKVQYSVFSDIFKTRWTGVWRLGQIIARTSLLRADKRRPFRRSQAFDLLCIIYKNHGFIVQETTEFNEYNNKIESAIQEYVQWAASHDQISPKEFSSLLLLLQELHKRSQAIQKYKCSIKWPKLCENIQTIRKNIELDSYQVYHGFCKRLDIQDIKNSEITPLKHKNGSNKVNGNQNSDGEDDDDTEEDDEDEDEDEDEKVSEDEPTPAPVNGVAKKRKAEADSNGLSKKRKAKLETKLRKQNRLKMSSVGLDGVSFSFAPANNDADMDSD